MFNNFLHSLSSRLSVAFIGFLVLVISAKYLGVSSRGEISLFLFNIALLQIITEVFTGYHLVHFMTKYNAYKIYSFGLVFALGIALLGNGLLYIGSKYVEGFLWQSVLITFLVTLHTFQCVMILGKGKLKQYYILSILQPALFLGALLGSVFFMHDFTFRAYVYPLLISFVLASLLSFTQLWSGLKSELDLKPFKSLPILKNGMAAQLGLMMFILGNKYSFYLIEPGADLGLYATAISITESVLILVTALLPLYLSKIVSSKDPENTFVLTVKLCKLSFLFCAFALLILNLLPESIYLKLLGEGFKGIKTIVLYYSPAVLFTSVYLVLSNYFSGKGEAGLVLKSTLPGFTITLLFTPWLVNNYHLKGATVTAFCVYFSNTLLLGLTFLGIQKSKARGKRQKIEWSGEGTKHNSLKRKTN